MPLRRPLGVHRISSNGDAAFLFTVVGRGTEWLSQRAEGDVLDLFGPLGNGFEIYPSSGKLLLVAGGIGIAPLVALAEQAVASGCSVTLLMGDKTSDRIYPERLLPSGIETVIATEDGSLGNKGMVTDLISEFVAEADQVFACGPLAMYRRMAELRGGLKNKSAQVLLEVVLGCGVGACLGCSIETRYGQKLVCKDGPVFELNDVIWNKAVAPPAGRRYFQEKVI
jgi:dihydroorotate dehydrogenase electron transfer subunit